LEQKYKLNTYLLKGTYSLDKASNTKAWLLVAKMVENVKKIHRERELRTVGVPATSPTCMSEMTGFSFSRCRTLTECELPAGRAISHENM
jgi:hypothetical protein